MEPLGAFKLLKGMAGPPLAAAREQWHRRRAAAGERPDPVTVGRELDEALDVLTGDAATLVGQAVMLAKSTLSDRSADFSDEQVREWLRGDAARGLLKRATVELTTGGDVEGLRQEAQLSYAASSGDAEWFGGALFDQAVAFLAFTLDARLPVHARLGIQVTNARADRIDASLRDIGAGLGAQPGLIADLLRGELSALAQVPEDVLGEHVQREVDLEAGARSVDDSRRLDRVVALATRVRDGDLRAAPRTARIAAFRLAAQMLARRDRLAEADAFLDAAAAVGAHDLASDRARLAIVRKDWAGALVLLAGWDDRTSTGLRIEALEGRDGREAALAQAADAGRLGGFMLPVVASWQIEAGRWAEAEALLGAADEDHIDENPVLLLVRARLRLALMLPESRRGDIVDNAGLFPQPSHLRDDPAGERLRAAAVADLQALETLAPRLRSPEFMQTVEATRLFLELGSSDQRIREVARATVSAMIADPATAVDYAWLALGHRMRFDERSLRAELDRAASLGGWNDAQFMTALQLAMRGDGGDDILPILGSHRERAARLLPPELANELEIEVLARKGRIEEARCRLAEAADALGPELTGRLELLVAEQEGENPVALRLAAFEASGSETDLHHLVAALADADDERAADYAIRLWRERRRMDDAVLACRSLFNAGRDGELDAFLDELGEVVASTPTLREHDAWRLYRRGLLEQARVAVEALRATDRDRPTLRQLAINVAVEAGDWHRLAPLVAEDLARRDHRDAHQLLQAAGLAHAADNPVADELARAAVAKEPEDPGVLMHAFTLAVRRGLDWAPEASGWLRRAIELSGEDGPIQRGSLEELVRMRDEGATRAAELDRRILSGELPLTLAARPLGTTMSELILGRLADNVVSPPLARLCLPLIAGSRAPYDLDGAGRIGLDPAAVLTLQLCGLLQETMDHLPGIVIPTGTLPLLLHDLEHANRIQPARVEQARRVKALVDSGSLRVLPASAESDDAAALHAHATALGARLVHAFPLHERGSLAGVVRDPAPFVDRLSSPDAVVKALARRGEITVADERSALEELAGLGGEWPDEPPVDLDRPLVLDGVVVGSLDTCRMLQPLVASGAELHVGADTLVIADREIAGKRRADDLERAIEAVRRTLSTALADGRAAMGPFRRTRRDVERGSGRELEMTPLISLLQDGSAVDVLVSGDRMVNGHGQFTDVSGAARPVATPLDVIDQLARTGAITPERRAAARRKLRDAGVSLVPVDPDELVEAASQGDWGRGPGRALRAIRDSIHLPLLRGALNLPADRGWLAGVVMALAFAIRTCWQSLPTVEAAEAAADHLLAMMPNASAWSEADPSPDAQAWGANLIASSHTLLASPLNVRAERLPAYHDWWTRVVEPRLEGRDRAVMADVHERLRLYLLLQDEVGEETPSGAVRLSAVDVRRYVAGHLPPALLERLTERADLRAALGVERDEVALAGRDVPVDGLADFLSAAVAGGIATLADSDGRPLATVEGARADGAVAAEIDGAKVVFREAGLFAGSSEVRLATFDRLLANRTISPLRAERWRALLRPEKVTAEGLMALMSELRHTPEAFVERVGEASADGLTFGALTETSGVYYGNLLDPELGDGTLSGALNALAEALATSPAAMAAVRAAGPLAVSPDFPITVAVAGMPDGEVAALGASLAGMADPFSVVAGVAVLASRARDDTCREAATVALERLIGTGGSLDGAAELFCTAGTIALATLDRCGSLAGAPPGFRRCLALAHAGHVCRALDAFEVDRAGLLDMGKRWAGPLWPIGIALDRCDGPVWAREWLVPNAIAAQVVRRLSAIVAATPADLRPGRWVELVDARAAMLDASGFGVALLLPGPVDEFGFAMPVATEDGAIIAEALATASVEDGEALLFALLWAHHPPADPDALEDVVAAFAARAAGAAVASAVAAALNVAARWGLAGLADRVADTLIRNRAALGLSASATLPHLVIACAAHAVGRRAEVLRELLRQLTFSGLDKDGFAALARSIDLLAIARPEWAGAIERMRSATLLGG